MNGLLFMSIFWIGYGILGLLGIQNIPSKYKGHSWTKGYIRKQGITWLLVGVPWLAFFLVCKFLIPEVNIGLGPGRSKISSSLWDYQFFSFCLDFKAAAFALFTLS